MFTEKERFYSGLQGEYHRYQVTYTNGQLEFTSIYHVNNQADIDSIISAELEILNKVEEENNG